MTTKTLELFLNKLPQKARRAFRVPDIQHNLIACAELIDAGCAVYLHRHRCKIEYEGAVIYKGWRDTVNRLWRLSLDPDAIDRITPHTDPRECDDTKEIMMSTDVDIKWSVNSIYEWADPKQLTKYYVWTANPRER